jgi:hypothetical protein
MWDILSKLGRWVRLSSLLIVGALLLCDYSPITSWPSNLDYTLAFGDVYALVGAGLLYWSGAAQTSWSGSNELLSQSDFSTYIVNNGGCGTSTMAAINASQAQSCALTSPTTGTISAGGVNSAYYTATFNSHTEQYTCTSHSQSSPATWAFTVSHANTPITIDLTGITYSGVASETLELLNPSSGVVYSQNISGASWPATVPGSDVTTTGTYTWELLPPTASAPMSCSPSDGPTGAEGGTSFTGTNYTHF